MSMIRLEKSRAMKECEKSRIPWVVVNAIVFVAIFICFQRVGPMLIQPFVPMLLRGKDEAGVYVTLTVLTNMMFLVLTILTMLYCLFIQKRSIASMGFYGSMGMSALVGIGTGLGLVVLVAGIQIALGAGLFAWSGTLPVFAGILFFLTTFIQSSGEEILCRGYFMNSLGGRHSCVFAVVVNAVVFGAVHLFNEGITPLAFINVTVAGIFFSVVAVRYNLWVSCWIHAMWNFSEGFIFGSSISGNEAMMSVFSVTPTNRPAWLTGGEFGIEGSIVVTIVYIIGIALVLLMPQFSRDRE